MKVYFWGVPPTPTLVQMLTEQQYAVATLSSPPAELHPNEILIHAEGVKAKHYPKRHLESLVIACVGHNPTPQDYETHPADDLWPLPILEQGFFTALARAWHLRKLRVTLQRLREQEPLVPQGLQALEQVTGSLVANFEGNVGLTRSLQEALLPQSPPLFPGVEILTRFLPSSGKGGDYFDLFILEEGRKLGLFVANSPGHTFTAKLLGELLKLKIEDMQHLFPTPQHFLDHLGKVFPAKERKGVGLFYAIFHRQTLTLEVACDGPIFWKTIRAQKFLPQNPLQLLPGDRVILGTHRLQEMATQDASLWEEKVTLSYPALRDLQNEILALEHQSLGGKPRLRDLVLILLELDPRTLFVKE